MSYVYPLTQFEVRYTHILNFNQIIRETLSPYLRMTTSFNFANQGRFEESLRINFEEEYYSIDCRWDRLIFVCEGDPNRFSRSGSTIKIFWEILQRLTELSTFGALRQSLFVSHEINLIDFTYSEILQKLKDKFLTKETERIMSEPNEMAIILEKGSKAKQITITFGPYTNADNKKYSLFPFKGPTNEETKGKFGTFLKFQVFEDLNKIDTELFKKNVEDMKNYSSHYLI